MISRLSCHPIYLFHLEDFNINAEQYIRYLRPYFFELAWDQYLYRQQQLTFIIQYTLPDHVVSDGLNNLFVKYYRGEVGEVALNLLIQRLSLEQLTNFRAINLTRRRAMQAFKVTFLSSDISIEPIEQQDFTQKHGLILETVTDWRKIKRVFNSPPKKMLTEELIGMIKALARKIMHYHANLVVINVFVHFTQIVAEPNCVATNSPEGIHQDGMDYIVSGLVIDRDNVDGGKSIIYTDNQGEEVLFETILKPKYGIFQPDRGTHLWHVVEPITPLDQSKPAYRSTIGIDFELVHAN